MNELFVARAQVRGAVRIAAAALPDDRAMERLSGAAFEDDNGFPLIGDAERRDVVPTCRMPTDHGGKNSEYIVPDFLGIVFNPTRFWEVLLMLARFAVDDEAVRIEQHGLGGGRTLIEREKQRLNR